jgi:hypothetical protein
MTGDVYIKGTGNLAKWTRSTNAWSTPSTSGSAPVGYVTPSGFDSKRKRFYLQGGDSNDHHYVSVDTGAWTTVTVTGARASDVTDNQEGMEYVPELDVYLRRPDSGGGDVIQITADGFVATPYPTTGGSGIISSQPLPDSDRDNGDGGTGAGRFGKFRYVPALGGMVFVQAYKSPTYFLKILDAEPTIPGGGNGEPPPPVGDVIFSM